MKHLMTLLALVVAVTAGAQTAYNPDSNGDNLIGVDDLTEFLPLWGQEFFPDLAELEFFDAGIMQDNEVYVPETADVVLIDHIYGTDGNLYLPNDTTFKVLAILEQNSGNSHMNIYGHIQPNGQFYTIRWRMARAYVVL
jgi:hypothetical protein